MTNDSGAGCWFQLMIGLLAAILLLNRQSAQNTQIDRTLSSIRATNNWVETQIYATETASAKMATVTPRP